MTGSLKLCHHDFMSRAERRIRVLNKVGGSWNFQAPIFGQLGFANPSAEPLCAGFTEWLFSYRLPLGGVFKSPSSSRHFRSSYRNPPATGFSSRPVLRRRDARLCCCGPKLLGRNVLDSHVAEHRLMSVTNQSVAVITRFDRTGKNRIPFISAASLLGLPHGEPYNGGTRHARCD